MKIVLQPSTAVEGALLVPPSKSYSQRALALAYLASGTSQVGNIGYSKDELVALGILTLAGARVSRKGNTAYIDSSSIESSPLNINCGESGLSARLFTPILAARPAPTKLDACGSLLKRPMHTFQPIFEQLKVRYEADHGHFPIVVQGPFVIPEQISVDGALSSQYVTGLLYALVGCKRLKPVSLVINNPTSIPYIRLSLEVLAKFGVQLDWVHGVIQILPTAKITGSVVDIEADWSSASFWIVAAAISGKVTLTSLNQQSNQADKAILEAVRQYGAKVTFEGEQLCVESGGRDTFEFDATNCPDLFPPLVALAATAEGVSTIHGVHRLYHKESNRALSLQQEFAKLGVNIMLQDDKMLIFGVKQMVGTLVQAHGDHRIVMACALAILKSKEPIRIEGAEAVDKSYPDFFKHLAHFGVNSYVDK